MEFNQAKARTKQAKQWAQSDPITLVSAAKHTLYSEIGNGGSSPSPDQLAPLEEVLSRFEQQCRAISGTVPVGSSQ